MEGQVEVLQWLLENGADVMALDYVSRYYCTSITKSAQFAMQNNFNYIIVAM